MAACIHESSNQNNASNNPFPANSQRSCRRTINSVCRLINQYSISNLSSSCSSIRDHHDESTAASSVGLQRQRFDSFITQPIASNVPKKMKVHDKDVEDHLWLKIQEEAKSDVEQEPILSDYYNTLILCHRSLERALANHLAVKLSNASLAGDALYKIFSDALEEDSTIKSAIRADLEAAKERDPACISYVHCFLHFKGFLACQAHRVAHKLWSQGRSIPALLIQNRVSEVFAVDIHPGAKIGRGILIDHATGVVIGETAVIGDNVSILHDVTLGGTGKARGDRHPKICDGVLIGAGTKVLGSIKIGEGAKIGAGSVVLKEVPPRATVVGNPARLVVGKDKAA